MLIFSPRTGKKRERQKLKFPATRENRVQGTVGHNFTNPPYQSPSPLRSVSTTHQSPVPPLIFKFTLPLYTLKPHHINFLLAQTLNPSEPTATAMAGQSDPQLSLFSAEEVSLSLSLCVCFNFLHII